MSEEAEMETEKPAKAEKMNRDLRKEYNNVLENKKNSLITSLQNGTLFQDKEQMKEQALKNVGLNFDKTTLISKIEEVDDEISTVVSKYIIEKTVERDNEIKDKTESLKVKIREREQAMQTEIADMKKELMGLSESVRAKYANVEKDLEQEHCKDLLDKKKSFEEMKVRAEKVEDEIEKDIRDKQRTIDKFKHTIIQTIKDRFNEACEILVKSNTKEEANRALDHIPPVSDLLMACMSKDGLSEFIKSLNPRLYKALPGPSNPNTVIVEDKNLKQVYAEPSNKEEVKAEEIVGS